MIGLAELVTLKIRRVEEPNSRDSKSSHYRGEKVWRMWCLLRYRPRHLTAVQNYESYCPLERQESGSSGYSLIGPYGSTRIRFLRRWRGGEHQAQLRRDQYTSLHGFS
ncbi:hypothetical protein TNCV_233191 [Trichonephila clavipes]|nr:hypothetical protein TNCV_233191 [Trichonephila clavipes]